jgi:HMG (high mobility group) box
MATILTRTNRTLKWTWKKPPGAPKRPLSAYNIFYAKMRQKILSERDGTTGGFTSLTMTISNLWRALPELGKLQYKDQARNYKENYLRLMKDWENSTSYIEVLKEKKAKRSLTRARYRQKKKANKQPKTSPTCGIPSTIENVAKINLGYSSSSSIENFRMEQQLVTLEDADEITKSSELFFRNHAIETAHLYNSKLVDTNDSGYSNMSTSTNMQIEQQLGKVKYEGENSNCCFRTINHALERAHLDDANHIARIDGCYWNQSTDTSESFFRDHVFVTAHLPDRNLFDLDNKLANLVSTERKYEYHNLVCPQPKLETEQRFQSATHECCGQIHDAKNQNNVDKTEFQQTNPNNTKRAIDVLLTCQDDTNHGVLPAGGRVGAVYSSCNEIHQSLCYDRCVTASTENECHDPSMGSSKVNQHSHRKSTPYCYTYGNSEDDMNFSIYPYLYESCCQSPLSEPD